MKHSSSTNELPLEWGSFLAALKSYIDDMKPKIDEIYDYPFFTPDDFAWERGTQAQKNVALRKHYNLKWLAASEQDCLASKEAITRQYIVNFGGIRKNSDERISRYAQASDEELAHGKLAGVASWSKVLSIRDPAAYAIYDARVAFSLNALQLQRLGHVGVWFPLLPTQNATLKRVQRPFANIKPKLEHRIKSKFAYRRYMEALSHAVGNGAPDDGEMILFAVAPKLARDWASANIPAKA
ncbi:hypothetical protein [Blastomonas sp. SL216]|uniref:hypothetical protein n=1 Tax=Blastomonas sp. SL216 TaxID=2995169 RepID=UPI002377BC83|nr:hypothetical protein OU999_14460 [Blastomonas sp. SL216]